MWSAIKRTTEPTSEPVSKAELKSNLRLDGSDQDDMLDVLIQASREAIEARLHRTLVNTTYTQYYDSFPKTIELYRPPVSVVTSIKYYDVAGDLQTVDAGDYVTDLNSLPPRINPTESWLDTEIRTGAVEILFTAGYGADSTSVPDAIRQAILMLASDVYEHPESNVELRMTENMTVKFLLSAYMVPAL